MDDTLDEKLLKQMKTVSVHVFAFLLNISPKTVYKWIKQGKINAIFVEGRWRIPISEYERITGREVIIAKRNSKNMKEI
jgi:excisionase family DNA binding protein